MLITFEGIDGCGKSSQAKLLADRLNDEGLEVVLLREPGGTDLSEHIRHLLLNRTFEHTISSEAELLLFAASRAQLVKEVILPALERNAVVICDRFIDSSIAYQVYGRGLPLDQVKQINALASHELEPDLTFLIDIPLDTAIQRRHGMGDDRMEAESRLFFSHVVHGYMKLAQEHPDRIHVIDGSDSMEDIHHSIMRLVNYERGNELRFANHNTPSEEMSAVYSFDVTSEVLAS